MVEPTDRCPCGTGLQFGECCGPYLSGDATPPTAERLMRSRYSAFSAGNADYLLETWHPTTRPPGLELDDDRRWLGLEILGRSDGGMLDARGTVEFRARSVAGGVRDAQHENSLFVRENRRWWYVSAL